MLEVTTEQVRLLHFVLPAISSGGPDRLRGESDSRALASVLLSPQFEGLRFCWRDHFLFQGA